MNSASAATPIASTKNFYGGRSSRDSVGGNPSSADRFQTNAVVKPAAPSFSGALKTARFAVLEGGTQDGHLSSIVI